MVNWHLRDSKFRGETILKEITIFQTADKHGSSYPNQGKFHKKFIPTQYQGMWVRNPQKSQTEFFKRKSICRHTTVNPQNIKNKIILKVLS